MKKSQLVLADHYGRSARAEKLALTDWATDRIGLPLLREVLGWFECEVVSDHPAGDHVLVFGRVIDGKLIDSIAEPMCYRETGAMDGASTLYPDTLGPPRRISVWTLRYSGTVTAPARLTIREVSLLH